MPEKGLFCTLQRTDAGLGCVLPDRDKGWKAGIQRMQHANWPVYIGLLESRRVQTGLITQGVTWQRAVL